MNLLMDNPEVRASVLAKSNVRAYLIQKWGIDDKEVSVAKIHVQGSKKGRFGRTDALRGSGSSPLLGDEDSAFIRVLAVVEARRGRVRSCPFSTACDAGACVFVAP